MVPNASGYIVRNRKMINIADGNANLLNWINKKGRDYVFVLPIGLTLILILA